MRILLALLVVTSACRKAPTPAPTRGPDYQQTLGRELAEKHCARCHDPESSAERVSNHDNLTAEAHPLGSVHMDHASLIAIIAHGGVALGKSPEMPPYSPTLSSTEIEALAAFINSQKKTGLSHEATTP